MEMSLNSGTTLAIFENLNNLSYKIFPDNIQRKKYHIVTIMSEGLAANTNTSLRVQARNRQQQKIV